MSDASRLASEIADLGRRLAALEKNSQLRYSSVPLADGDVKVVDALQTGVGADAKATVAQRTADEKNSVTWSINPPGPNGETLGDVWFQRTGNGPIVGQWEWTASGWTSRAVGSEVIANLTAGKITTGTLAAGVSIIAGNPASTHAELTDTGLRVYADDPVDGVPDEVIRLGTTDDDYFGVVDANGSLKASIDSGGGINATSLNVTADPVFQGTPLSQTLADIGSIVGEWHAALGSDIGPIQSRFGIGEVPANLVAGRAYKVSWRVPWKSDGAPSEARFYIRSERGTATNPNTVATPTINSATGDAVWYRPASATAGNFVTDEGSVTVFPTVTSRARFLLTIERGVGNGSLWVLGSSQTQMLVQDLGPTAGIGVGGYNNGGGTFYNAPAPAPPSAPSVQSYYMDVQANWSSSHRGDGSLRGDVGTDVYQGVAPGGTNGSQFGYFGWPDIWFNGANGQPPLNGSTITRMDVYLYSKHWYYNSGGKPVLNLHGQLGYTPGVPPRVGGKSDWVPGPTWPKPGGVWVTMPADWYPLFANGTARGLTLGQASGDPYFYGIFSGANAGLGYVPGLRIWYRK